MKIKIKSLESLVKSALKKKFSEQDANLIADVILFGELSGKTSHGLVRLIIEASSVLAQHPTGKPELIRKTKVSTLIEANGNPAMLVAPLAMQEVINLTKQMGGME